MKDVYDKKKEYMNSIFDGMTELVAAMDINFNFTYFNIAYKKEFKKIFGPDIKIGDNILDKLIHLKEDMENMKNIWGRAINGEEFTVIQKFGDKNKERNTYEIKYSSIKDINGNIIGASHIVRDVTIREKIRVDAERTNKVKDKFLSNISHELRTPMNAILGFAQLIQYDSNCSNVETYSKSIIRSGKYLLNLINDTLDYNKIQAGILLLSLEVVNAYSVIFEVFSDLLSLCNGNNISMWLKCKEHKNINIYVDKQRYKQTLINLISNAIKYNKKSGMIEIITRIENGMLYVDIKDTGIGISKENLDKIWDPFERLDNELSSIQGTGLGLSITKMICCMMNGDIKVQSTLGKGSIFSIGFVIKEDFIENKCDCIKNNNNHIEINTEYRGNIIYIEDNEFNLMLMDNIIKIYFPNVEYKYIQNGTIGYNLIKKTKPNIVLLDINIPDMNGVDILRNIKSIKDYQDIKIIILSADITDNIEEKCISLGADGYLSKPLTINSLVTMINKNKM